MPKCKFSGVSRPTGSPQACDAWSDSGVTQPAGSDAAANVSEQLVQGVLDKLMGDVTETVARAHYTSNEPLPELNKAR